MRIKLKDKAKDVEIFYEIFDRTDKFAGDSSMGRTTGFVACAVANLMLEGGVERQGIIPPEILARKRENFDYVLNYLKSRNIKIEKFEA